MPLHMLFDPRELLGQKIGDYELREVLGTGNSAVYRAYDPGKNDLVALKLVRWPGANVDAATLKRFKREIELLRKRRHEHIINIYDWRTSGDYVFLVMEACEGTLADWMLHHKPKLSEALLILEPLAEAIDFLHTGSEQVLHRDIKPQNILFKGDNWFISDFSIARGETDQNITLNGQALGTLRYAAPEQIMGGKLGPETDIYSFGVVVFEVLAGGWPFAERDPSDWSYPIPDITRFNPQLSRDVSTLFKRWLSPDPQQRPKRALVAVRELAAIAGILRDPSLARLYDVAADLAGQPRDQQAWHDALSILDVIRGYEPQFTDPRGIETTVHSRLQGAEPGPAPLGYTGKPSGFYSETTIAGSDATVALAPIRIEVAPKVLRPTVTPRDDFVPRSRYDCDAILQVPAEVGVGGSVFGRAVIVDEQARVSGDLYALGDIEIGPNAEIDGIVVAGGTVTLHEGARVNGPAGIQAGALKLEPGSRVEGWVSTLGAMSLASGSDVEGALAGGPLTLADGSRSFSPSAASAGGDINLQDGVVLADTPTGTAHIHPWPSTVAGDSVMAGKGHIASVLLTSELLSLCRDVLHDAAPPSPLPAPSFGTPRPITKPALLAPPATDGATTLLTDEAEEAPAAPGPLAVITPAPTQPTVDRTRLEVGVAGDTPSLFRESVIRVVGERGPEELPLEPERALAAAWLLDRAWVTYLERLRIPGLVVGVAVIAAIVLTFLLGSPLPAILWILCAVVGAAIAWWLRPRPLALARVYWAWHSYGGVDGALVWDTRRDGGDEPYPELLSDPSQILPMTEKLGSTHDDVALLGTLHRLTSALSGMEWQAWPGVFEPRAEAAEADVAAALLRLGFERGLPSEIAKLPVLRPVLAPDQVKAAASWLRNWPADGARQRRALTELASRMKAANSQLGLWTNARGEATRRIGALKKAWEVQSHLANELAERTFSLLEEEVNPDASRVWSQHEASALLISEYFAHQRKGLGEQFAQEKSATDGEVRRATTELERQQAALQKLDAELGPLPARWKEAAAAHEQARAALQEAWDRARAGLARQEAGGGMEPFVRPRTMDLRGATQQLAQLGDAASPLERRLEDLQAEANAAERAVGINLPWPQWPMSMDDRMESGVVARDLNAFSRKLRAEAVTLRTRIENATNLRGSAEYALEGALGALEAVDGALVGQEQRDDGVIDPETGRLRSLRSRSDSSARALRKVVNSVTRLQRRLQAAEASYNEFAESLAAAVKDGRAGRAWEEGRTMRTEYERLAQSRVAAQNVRDAAQASLERARTERARKGEEENETMRRIAALDQSLVRRSHNVATRDERQLRRHIDEFRSRHEAVLATMRRREGWPDVLARFETGCFDTRVSALEHLRGRAAIFCDLGTNRLAQTEKRRAAALRPEKGWPNGEMRYLVPVWLLQYRPGGSRSLSRLLALTPADMQPVANRGGLRVAGGFDLLEEEALAARFSSEVLAPALHSDLDELPGRMNLLDDGDRQMLLSAWEALARDHWIPRWLRRYL